MAPSESGSQRGSRRMLLVAVVLSGVSGLSWELLWQHHASLALGVSAVGTAITLAAMMLGMGLGGLLTGSLARRGLLSRPLLAYGVAELIIAAGGLLAPVGFIALSEVDSALYAASPALATVVRTVGTGTILLLPSVAMGATIPILAPVARRLGSDVAIVYALNTAGAVVGVALATFVALPRFGVSATGAVAAAINICVAVWAVSQRTRMSPAPPEAAESWPAFGALALAFASGSAVFILEVSWFRSIRAAFQSTTETFALILIAFLSALSLGGWLAPRIKRRFPDGLVYVACAAAFFVLVATPEVDRLDQVAATDVSSIGASLQRLWLVSVRLAVPVTAMGVLFPWLLSSHDSSTGAGRLYAVNTAGAVVGAVAAGFVLLPLLGATKSSWLAAGLLGVGALLHRLRVTSAIAVVVAIAAGSTAAITGDAGDARHRVHGFEPRSFIGVLYIDEGPDSTVWVTEKIRPRVRALVIDGFEASAEGPGTEYMRFMGHLPALAAGSVDTALVICFGTGQTAYSVYRHEPEALHVVDVSAAVLGAADLFPTNHGVLTLAGVHSHVMDGRAFLRRTEARFDVVTLEPMPPNFAGVNNLYSREFYELVATRLAPGGVVAQWVPYHLISADHMRGIVAAFVEVYPFTRLWHDPNGGTGILVGSGEPWEIEVTREDLELEPSIIEAQYVLGYRGTRALARTGVPVTDDNQLLSYGLSRLRRSRGGERRWSHRLSAENRAIVRGFAEPRAGGDAP